MLSRRVCTVPVLPCLLTRVPRRSEVPSKSRSLTIRGALCGNSEQPSNAHDAWRQAVRLKLSALGTHLAVLQRDLYDAHNVDDRLSDLGAHLAVLQLDLHDARNTYEDIRSALDDAILIPLTPPVASAVPEEPHRSPAVLHPTFTSPTGSVADAQPQYSGVQYYDTVYSYDDIELPPPS
ncbi:hypothetical protein FOA52_010571 [Chlamydomonas sp. UWO 241]|nr:hypothetical protein FOA52_010571 [Chlamydomonas sp. UWO 241]